LYIQNVHLFAKKYNYIDQQLIVQQIVLLERLEAGGLEALGANVACQSATLSQFSISHIRSSDYGNMERTFSAEK